MEDRIEWLWQEPLEDTIYIFLVLENQIQWNLGPAIIYPWTIDDRPKMGYSISIDPRLFLSEENFRRGRA